MLFIMSLNFTERGIREIKDDRKRVRAAQDLAKKCGCEIKQIFLTSGEYDALQIIETANAENIAKYALANGSLGFVRSRTALAWPLEEATKIISELRKRRMARPLNAMGQKRIWQSILVMSALPQKAVVPKADVAWHLRRQSACLRAQSF
jgi:uncharacterized protein with GYD domain